VDPPWTRLRARRRLRTLEKTLDSHALTASAEIEERVPQENVEVDFDSTQR
jgi:hypothetical protein